jgi:hypothetical protein
MFVNCQTTLSSTFRELYPIEFEYEGDRTILFSVDRAIDEAALRDCIALALTYHFRKRNDILCSLSSQRCREKVLTPRHPERRPQPKARDLLRRASSSPPAPALEQEILRQAQDDSGGGSGWTEQSTLN